MVMKKNHTYEIFKGQVNNIRQKGNATVKFLQKHKIIKDIQLYFTHTHSKPVLTEYPV